MRWIDVAGHAPPAGTGERVLVWHEYQGAMLEYAEFVCQNPFFTHWMPLSEVEGGWISAQSRKPTKNDADPMGCVLIKCTLRGIMVTGWHQFSNDGNITHWQRLPEKP